MSALVGMGTSPTLWNHDAWKQLWDKHYENIPCWSEVKFFHTYHTSPTFGIFRIRS